MALYGVGALVTAGILGLATVLEEAGPPKPEQALDSMQRDIETAKARARS